MAPSRPRHPKTDANQADVIRELRECGLIVHDVSSLGGDCLDLFVGDPASCSWLQVEVKTEEGQLTPRERAYIALHIVLVPIVVAWDTEDILRALGRLE
ncbi:MAG TPA: hypothetical protein VM537_15390 [Anaerolineae bacterium]|nr:hypothetical protein [Anaerolineae bacterium]